MTIVSIQKKIFTLPKIITKLYPVEKDFTKKKKKSFFNNAKSKNHLPT